MAYGARGQTLGNTSGVVDIQHSFKNPIACFFWNNLFFGSPLKLKAEKINNHLSAISLG